MTTFNHSGNAGDIIYSIPFMNGIKGLKNFTYNLTVQVALLPKITQ